MVCLAVCFSHQTELTEAGLLHQDVPSIQHSAWHMPGLSRHLLEGQNTPVKCASSFCRRPPLGRVALGSRQMFSLGLWCVVRPVLARPGPCALASGSGFQDTGLQAVSHSEGSQPGLDPHQPSGQWVSCPAQHHPCKHTSVSSLTNSLGQGAGRTT